MSAMTRPAAATGWDRPGGRRRRARRAVARRDDHVPADRRAGLVPEPPRSGGGAVRRVSRRRPAVLAPARGRGRPADAVGRGPDPHIARAAAAQAYCRGVPAGRRRRGGPWRRAGTSAGRRTAAGLAFKGNETESQELRTGSSAPSVWSMSRPRRSSPAARAACLPGLQAMREYDGWAGSKLFSAAGAHAERRGGRRAVLGGRRPATGTMRPWIGLEASASWCARGRSPAAEVLRQEPRRMVPGATAAASSTCGRSSTTTTEYQNFGVFSTNFFGYAGYVGEGPCGDQCDVLAAGAGGRPSSTRARTSRRREARWRARIEEARAAFRRPIGGYRYFIILMDTASRTVQLAIRPPRAEYRRRSRRCCQGLPGALRKPRSRTRSGLRLPKLTEDTTMMIRTTVGLVGLGLALGCRGHPGGQRQRRRIGRVDDREPGERDRDERGERDEQTTAASQDGDGAGDADERGRGPGTGTGNSTDSGGVDRSACKQGDRLRLPFRADLAALAPGVSWWYWSWAVLPDQDASVIMPSARRSSSYRCCGAVGRSIRTRHDPRGRATCWRSTRPNFGAPGQP